LAAEPIVELPELVMQAEFDSIDREGEYAKESKGEYVKACNRRSST